MSREVEKSGITADGVASVAATLSVNSQRGQQKKDLVENFWFFFNLIATDVNRAKRQHDREVRWAEEIALCYRYWRGNISGRWETRFAWTLRAGYIRGDLEHTLAELTDEELLKLRGIGVKTLPRLKQFIATLVVK